MYEPIEEDTSFKTRSRRFITQCIRVLKITKKPNRDEYRTLVKVSGLGIAVIGLIGFLLHVIFILLFPVA
jgi:protein transport protein SEC61 subunit gamma and related proteins